MNKNRIVIATAPKTLLGGITNGALLGNCLLRKLGLPISLFLFFQTLSLAQMDTMVILREVSINAPRNEQFSTGYAIRYADSATQRALVSMDASRLLALESALTVRTYSPGGLASVSVGGFGSQHTAVLWRGFNLQSPMVGIYDLSLIPLLPGDRLGIQTGGVSALHGGGAAGGAIIINRQEDLRTGWHGDAAVWLGNWGQQGQILGISGAKKWWKGSLRATSRRADNDFPYVNYTKIGRPLEKRVNAALNQSSLFTEQTFLLGPDQRLDLFAWWQKSDRRIPPPITATNGLERQTEHALRAGAEWAKLGENTIWKVRSVWLDEFLAYKSLAVDSSGNRVQTWVGESDVCRALGQHYRISMGVHAEHSAVKTNNYDVIPDRWRSAVYVSGRADWSKRWAASVNLRQEWVDANRSPFTWSLGATWNATRQTILRGGVGRVFNVPTFNDRFWNVVGNPDLLPENGWNLRLEGEHLLYGTQHAQIRLIETVRTATLREWIQWSPDAGGIWRPRNLKTVWTRGMDWAILGRWELGANRTIQARLQYTLNIATTTAILNPAEAYVIGKQLIFMPVHAATGTFSATFRKVSTGMTGQYGGARFAQSDNAASSKQQPFFTSDVWVEYRFVIPKNIRMGLQVSVQNVFDQAYEVIRYRPMPGRGGVLRLTVGF